VRAAAPELLGAPIIGGGSARPGGSGGGSQRSQISLPSHLECTKTVRNDWFPSLIDFKNAKYIIFNFKVLHKIYSQDFFEEYINFLKICNLRHCGVICVQSFGSQICPQLPRLGLKHDVL
jgi:hypothetical protein